MSKRLNSLFSVGDVENEEETLPHAKIDVALVGVEHAGKTTFFKQITSMYAKEDFATLLRSDGRSQAMGRMLKITLTILKPILEELERDDSKAAAKVLLKSFTLYSLSKETSIALKTVWNDPVFFSYYKKSPFFQANDLKKDIEECDRLLDESYVIPKNLHLKLHNATHGYNSTKFTFISTQRLIGESKSQNEAKSMPVLSQIDVNSKKRLPTKSIVSEQIQPRKGRKGSILESMGASNLFRSRVLRSVTRAFSSKFDSKLQKRVNEVSIYDIGGLFERRTDWEYFLRRTNLTLFFVSLAGYSTVTDDGSEENLMQDSLNMFQILCESEFLKDHLIQVVLTKKDIFAEKMKMKIPLNVAGLFPDAPDGDEKFDEESNIDYIKEMFLKLTETENSFLTRENVNFRVINLFEEKRVKEFFVDCVGTVRAEDKVDSESDSKRGSKNTEEFFEILEKHQRPRGLSVRLKSVGEALRKSLRINSSPIDPTGLTSPKQFYSSKKVDNRIKRRSRKKSQNKKKSKV